MRAEPGGRLDDRLGGRTLHRDQRDVIGRVVDLDVELERSARASAGATASRFPAFATTM